MKNVVSFLALAVIGAIMLVASLAPPAYAERRSTAESVVSRDNELTVGSMWRTAGSYYHGHLGRTTIVILRARPVIGGSPGSYSVQHLDLETGEVWKGMVGDLWISKLRPVESINLRR